MNPARARLVANHKRDVFSRGLEAAGFIVTHVPDPRPGDVILGWNRKSQYEHEYRRFESVGARVLIAENGYIGEDKYGNRLISVADFHHLGCGQWHVGSDRTRWKKQGINLEPWRKSGREIVLLPQRGIGERGIAMPQSWAEDAQAIIRRQTSIPVRIRKHPGKDHGGPSLREDLQDAMAVVTWGSSAALKAIAMGIPCFHALPGWIGSPVSQEGIHDIVQRIRRPRREGLFHRISYSQYTQEEIARGVFL